MSWRVLLLVILTLWSSPAGAQTSPFPHARHARLFLSCSACHAGIASDDSTRLYPSPSLCSNCHNGTVTRDVRWSSPLGHTASLLIFSHRDHLAKTKEATCATCHALADTVQWMNVGHASSETCFGCHAHRTSGHFAADSKCSTCHRTLLRTALTDSQLAALPKPTSHQDPAFATKHGAMARAGGASCALCHSRESCARCHVDASRSPVITALGSDARVARLLRGRPPAYYVPADHRDRKFVLEHGAVARDGTARCAICHARASCESCHTGVGGRDVIAQLSDANAETAPGVQLRLAANLDVAQPVQTSGFLSRIYAIANALARAEDTTRKVRVHPLHFLRMHYAVAASGELQCSGCHTQRFCTDCHGGERVTRRYHPTNFLYTHAPQAYGRETDCTSCHSTEAFCRSCHRQLGLAAKTNARSTVFHNAQPLWLLQHGRAARQGLNACATCHQQTYCMQCHSDLGARINPHGPGFDAAKMQSRNPGMCLMCHFSNPLAK
jgi:hypothetical protein